jgi:hypothetical protein
MSKDECSPTMNVAAVVVWLRALRKRRQQY